jgi:hypothetical protein
VPTYECVERSGPQSSCACHLHTPPVLRRPPSSHTCHPHTLHVLEAMIPLIPFSYNKQRYLLVVVVVVVVVVEEEEEEEEEKSVTAAAL